MEQNNSMDPNQLSPVGKNLLNLIEFDKDEILVDEIRKHHFGLFIIYFTGFSIATIIFIFFAVMPSFLNSDALDINLSSYSYVFAFLGLLLVLLSAVATFIGSYLYKNDVIIVTNEKIAQVLYKTIFNRKISQLSIGDVQDVTVYQEGVFPRIFKYGTIVIETAGEQANYKFTYVPDPYRRAKNIVGSHEKNLTQFGN
jgi:uncharacterized membrane protein YdbT with pleckstrin-like domain